MGYGILGHVGISYQDSFGTANVDSHHWFPIINESISESIPPLLSEGMKGRFEEGDDYEGPHEITGDIVFPPDPILVGKVLKAWFGQSSGTLVDSCYNHSFIPRTVDWDDYAAVPPMTLEIYRDAGSAHQYYDCLAEGFSLEIVAGELLKITMSVLGGKFAKMAKSTPTYMNNSEYTWDQTSVSLAGTTIDDILNLTFTGANNLEGRHTLDNTKTYNRIKRGGRRTIEVAGAMLFVNDDEFDNFRNQTKQRLVVNVAGQDVSSGYPGNLTIDIPSMKFNEFPVNIGGPGLIEVALTAAARFNVGSNTMAEFTLVNTETLY